MVTKKELEKQLAKQIVEGYRLNAEKRYNKQLYNRLLEQNTMIAYWLGFGMATLAIMIAALIKTVMI